ncbi:MAG: energy-coupling factor transporter transmembrane component T family protein [Anaerolineae bacterium]|jgi:energy-coupling factor transport system permease protein|nr:energy-coupling factor transporter transmembrane protein EcfT [Chloroflexota bacterium]
MNQYLELYLAGDSWLHRLDPRAKLALVLCMGLCLLVTANLWLVLVALVALLAVLGGAVGWRPVLRTLQLLLPTVALVMLLWALVNPLSEGAILVLGPVQLGALNLALAAAIALRIAALALVVFLLLYTTETGTLVQGLVALRVPFAWGLTLGMALRYLPTMARAFRSVSEAQQARGLQLEGRGLLQRARAYTPIAIAMLISALRGTQSVSWGLEARGLGAVPRRTWMHELHLEPLDYVVAVGALILSGVYIYGRLRCSLGADPLRLWG